jgi:hypothetical protein
MAIVDHTQKLIQTEKSEKISFGGMAVADIACKEMQTEQHAD